jgi:capsular polysaccharide export protein
MIAQGIHAFRNKRILLLQGPIGPFFQRLAAEMTDADAQVFKINFNGGDWLFYPRNSICYRGDADKWPAFFEHLVDVLKIDTVMLFGDCRIYHAKAYDIARRRGLEVGVFEEGYFRPDYITLEREGVNGYSELPDNPIFYLNSKPVRTVPTAPVGNSFWYCAAWVFLYYLAAQLLGFLFLRYQHHRPLSAFEGLYWVRSAWRKGWYAFRQRGVQEKLVGELSKKFFLVPLQVHNDAQIHVHSGFLSVAQFLEHVVSSFSAHAPGDATLVLKHHPMDRGYSDYSTLIDQLRDRYALGSRLLYVHDLHLPSLLQHARGVVVVNSTVGLSALFHNAIVKVCGDSIYNMKGLTYQGDLDQFWHDASDVKVDSELFSRFRSYVIDRTQINGNFYKRLPVPGSATGMRWEKRATPAFVECREKHWDGKTCRRDLTSKQRSDKGAQPS